MEKSVPAAPSPSTANKPSHAALPLSEAVARLCPECGLCCNGVLFVDVKLQDADGPERLAALGLPVKKRGARHRLAQPCAAFDGRFCGIYSERPSRCRDFHCRLLQRVQSGKLSPKAALGRIGQALRQVAALKALLRRMGSRDEALPINRRYRWAAALPVDLAADGEAAKWHGRLLKAMHRLVQRLHRDFLTG